MKIEIFCNFWLISKSIHFLTQHLETFCIEHWLGKSLLFLCRIHLYLFYDPFWKRLIGCFLIYLYKKKVVRQNIFWKWKYFKISPGSRLTKSPEKSYKIFKYQWKPIICIFHLWPWELDIIHTSYVMDLFTNFCRSKKKYIKHLFSIVSSTEYI